MYEVINVTSGIKFHGSREQVINTAISWADERPDQIVMFHDTDGNEVVQVSPNTGNSGRATCIECGSAGCPDCEYRGRN